MGKLLFLVLIGVAVYLFARALARQSRAQRPAASAPRPESIVPCAHCGLYLPRSEALPSGGRFYCSEEHRRLEKA